VFNALAESLEEEEVDTLIDKPVKAEELVDALAFMLTNI